MIFTQTTFLAVGRHALSALGGFAIAKGYITAENAESLIGAAMAILAVVFSLLEKHSADKK